MENMIRIPLGGVLNANGPAATIANWDISALTAVNNSATSGA